MKADHSSSHHINPTQPNPTQPFSQWDQIFDDNMMTIAAIDRIVHHSTVIDCQGESFRKKHALKKGEEK